MLSPYLFNHILAFAWAFLISVFAIPSIIHVAHIKKLLDEPNTRTIHESLTPRLGGLAIFAGFMSSLTIFGDMNYGIKEILAGSIVIFFIGLKDDIVSVSAFKKFFVQVLATGIIMFMADIRIKSFYGLLGIYNLELGFSYAFTFFVIIGITNAINLIDGLDGLAGTIIFISGAFFSYYFFNTGTDAYLSYSIVSICLVGSILGFLRYNVHKAIIFMGDTGSLVSGYIIAILAIQFVEMKPAGEISPVLSIAILIIPIMDTLRVFLLRILSGVSPFAPDKNHIHHRLIDLNIPQIYAVLTLALINIIAIILVLLLSSMGNNYALGGIVIFALVISVLLEILKKKKKNEKI